MVITLLGENNYAQAPSRAELQEWAQAFGLQHPVTSDVGFGVTFSYVDGYYVGLPSLSLLREGAEVVINDGSVFPTDVIENLP
jgi:hypothetical protein